MLKRTWQFLVISMFAVAASGCVVEPSSCGYEPDEPIEEFEVTISSGDDPCDCDVKFCFKRYSSHDWECGLLDKPLYDDFEPWETDTYFVVAHPAVDVGDLESFELVNTNCPFFNSQLSVSWIEVYGIDHWGDAIMLYEEEFDPYEVIYEDEALVPDTCHY